MVTLHTDSNKNTTISAGDCLPRTLSNSSRCSDEALGSEHEIDILID